MAIEITRYRDEAKLLSDDLKRIIHEAVEREVRRPVHSIELHGDGRSGIGAATIKFAFPDEQTPARAPSESDKLLRRAFDALVYVQKLNDPAPDTAAGWGVRADLIRDIEKFMKKG